MSLTETKKTKLIVVLGPTAVGKTKLGINIAKRIGACIISADSLQVYKHFDIGTAKPSREERKQTPHYLIDIINPDEDFNAGKFRELALAKIDELASENKKIVVVGGTFLYVRVLLSGLLENIGVDYKFRDELKEIRDRKGVHFLHETLKNVDPESAKKINKNDYVRIERALEVFHLTGRVMSEHQKRHSFQDKRFETYKIGLYIERDKLRKRIDKRVDQMIEQGFVDEVRSIRERGYSAELKPMKSIGYKQINNYLDGNITLERAVEIIKRDTKRFAKRQMTWLRADKEINWFDADVGNEEIVQNILEFYS
ncbi:MAG: tRNA (adenosine(37)-N6)-dimethylallyltransferase MiaA [Candidatus Dadabacteria bacterium]|nr:tRNA (adenosine(37)-N6)-dimethylallyltransferase MiaA [Candidatus Dadabacteria bacterium]NIQ16364.1 tRNA (adenosine(37)-N6)-dimethylallyltransferase MiaA [Candidatus Dadabacteria bacterium]